MVPAGNLAYQSNAVSQRVLTKRRIIKASFPAPLKMTNMLPRGPSPVKRLQVGLFELGGKGLSM
jgi:hypothetical protein